MVLESFIINSNNKGRAMLYRDRILYPLWKHTKFAIINDDTNENTVTIRCNNSEDTDKFFECIKNKYIPNINFKYINDVTLEQDNIVIRFSDLD